MQYKDLELTKYAQDGFRIDAKDTSGNKHIIYIDPFKLPDGQPPADLILITHEHFDHCDPASIAKVLQPTTIVYGNTLVKAKLEDLHVIGYEEVSPECRGLSPFADLAVEIVPAYNTTKFREGNTPFHPVANGGVGYVLNFTAAAGKIKVYHMGDTDFLPLEQTIHDVDILMLPVSGTYVMTAAEAAEACQQIKPQIAIPMHYDGNVVGSWEDAEYLKANSGCTVEILQAER